MIQLTNYSLQVERERRGRSRKWAKEEQQSKRQLSIKETVDKVDCQWRSPPRNCFRSLVVRTPSK